MFGQSLTAMWKLVNMLQLVHYSAMLTLYFPRIVIVTSSHLSASNLQNKYFADIYMFHFNSSEFDEKPSDYRLRAQHIDSMSILMNSWDMFVVFVLVIVISLIPYSVIVSWFRNLCWKSVSKHNQKSTFKQQVFGSFLQRLDRINSRFLFNTLFRMLFEMFLNVWFAGIFNVYHMNWNTTTNRYSNIVAFVWLFIMLAFIFTVLTVYNYYPETYTVQQINKSKIRILYQDFYENNKHLILDHVFFLLRRLLLIVLIIFKVDYFFFLNHSLTQGQMQSIIFLGGWVFILLWKLIMRPYNNIILNIQDISFEMFFSTIIYIYYQFNSVESQLVISGKYHRLGVAWVILIWMMVAVNIAVMTYFWIKRVKQWKFKRGKKVWIFL